MDGFPEQGQYGDDTMHYNDEEFQQEYDSELGFATNGYCEGNEMRDSIGYRDSASGSVRIFWKFRLSGYRTEQGSF